jgi:hypothetical protein
MDTSAFYKIADNCAVNGSFGDTDDDAPGAEENAMPE